MRIRNYQYVHMNLVLPLYDETKNRLLESNQSNPPTVHTANAYSTVQSCTYYHIVYIIISCCVMMI